MKTTRLALVATTSLVALVLFHDDASAQESDAHTERAEETVEVGDGPVLGPLPTEDYVRDVNAQARGLGIGLGQGLWGTSFAQSLRLDVPFGLEVGQFFGVRVQGLIAYGPFGDSRFDPVVLGAIEPLGRSPVMFGVARIYGGGGIHIGGRPNPGSGDGDDFGVAGGGHLGIEIFAMPWWSYSVEVGGQGSIHAVGFDAGASVMGGMTFYVGGS